MSNQLVHERGYWLFGDQKTVDREHVYDRGLAEGIVEFLTSQLADSVIDFGCGNGMYVRRLVDAGFAACGYDGNPNTVEICKRDAGTRVGVRVADLTTPLDLFPADWVLCLEVMEHIPDQFSSIALDNLSKHAKVGMILSWCIPESEWPVESGITREGGLGHVNCKPNVYVEGMLALRGWVRDLETENSLRRQARCKHFKYTTMVYTRSQA